MTKRIVLFAALMGARSAVAQELTLAVDPQDGCPTASAVREELALLLPTLPLDAGNAAALLSDLGDRFRLTLHGADRIFVDPARDCQKRARTAAVALAVELAPPTVTYAPMPQEIPPLPADATIQPTPPIAIVFEGANGGDENYQKGRSEVIAGAVLMGASVALGAIFGGLTYSAMTDSIDHRFDRNYDHTSDDRQVQAGLTLGVIGFASFVSGIVLTAVGARQMKHARAHSKRMSWATTLGTPSGTTLAGTF
jgi:hypothetical protein